MASTGLIFEKVKVEGSKKNYTAALVILTSLFFMWGFITSSNDILIPFLNKILELSRSEFMLAQIGFYGPLFIGSLVYFIISSQKRDYFAWNGLQCNIAKNERFKFIIQ